MEGVLLALAPIHQPPLTAEHTPDTQLRARAPRASTTRRAPAPPPPQPARLHEVHGAPGERECGGAAPAAADKPGQQRRRWPLPTVGCRYRVTCRAVCGPRRPSPCWPAAWWQQTQRAVTAGGVAAHGAIIAPIPTAAASPPLPPSSIPALPASSSGGKASSTSLASWAAPVSDQGSSGCQRSSRTTPSRLCGMHASRRWR